MEWRQINQVDDILERWNPPEVLEKYYSMGTTGFDKYGCPSKFSIEYSPKHKRLILEPFNSLDLRLRSH